MALVFRQLKDFLLHDLNEEQTDSYYTDDGAKDLAEGDTLMEEEGRRGNDKYGRERHDGLGDAGGGVEGGHQRQADTDARAEERGSEGAEHRLAVAHGMNKLLATFGTETKEGNSEAHDADKAANHGGGEGHDSAQRELNPGSRHDIGLHVGNAGSGDGKLIVFHAHFAEHQSATLAHAGTDAEKDALEGEAELEAGLLLAAALGQDSDADTEKGDEHAGKSKGAHLLAQKESAHKSGGGCGEGHEELAEARAHLDIAVKEAVVAEDIAHHAREAEPKPGAAVGELGVRRAGSGPEDEGQKGEGYSHAGDVQRQGSDAFGGHLGEEGSDGPGKGHTK